MAPVSRGRAAGGDGYLARIIAVLEVFDSELSALKVSAIAAATGLPLATTYRLVGELVGHGFLARDADGRIRLGVRLWELANRGSPLNDLREAARGELIAVHAATGFHTNLAVLREGAVLVVDRIVADTPLPNRSVTAARMSALRSSLGLAMLAHAPFAQVRLAVALELAGEGGAGGGPVEGAADGDAAFTAAEDAALGRLRETRRRGYARQRGLQDASTMGVAAPVLDARGAPVASVGVIMPVATSTTIEQAAAERLRHVAARVAARLAPPDASGTALTGPAGGDPDASR